MYVQKLNSYAPFVITSDVQSHLDVHEHPIDGADVIDGYNCVNGAL